MLTALGVAGVRARIAGRRARAAFTAALLLLAAAGAALDTRGLRAPLASAAVPAAYDVIGRDPERAAIIDLPAGFLAHGFALFSSLYMYYQTSHRKPLLEGTVARLPVGVRRVVTRPAERRCSPCCSRAAGSWRRWRSSWPSTAFGIR